MAVTMVKKLFSLNGGILPAPAGCCRMAFFGLKPDKLVRNFLSPGSPIKSGKRLNSDIFSSIAPTFKSGN